MERRPVIVENGELKELPVGDTVAGVPGVSVWKEPVSAYNDGAPEIIFTDTGDVVMNDAA